VHVPEPLQVSAPLQTLESEHDVPAATGVCVTPPLGSQESVVQGFPSSLATGAPPAQLPEAQASPVVQAFASSQLAPLGLLGFEHAPLAGLQVPAR
jgi:hypothetical protein